MFYPVFCGIMVETTEECQPWPMQKNDKIRRLKDMANTYKVKRGMVFWYNLDERIDKNSRPMVLVDGKEYPDHRQYGMRHWLVVSNDEGNASSPTCTAVPITGANGKTNIPAHATVTFRGRKFEVLCEQIMTVNIVSLKEYAYTLSDNDMRNVDRALAVQCSLTQAANPSETESRLLQAEQRMENLISLFENSLKDIVEGYEKRLASLAKEAGSIQAPPCKETAGKKPPKKKSVSDKEFNHPTHPATGGVSGKSGPRVPSHKHLSQIEKFNARYPDAVQDAKPVLAAVAAPAPLKKQTGAKRHKWTQEMMLEYLDDTATLPPMRTAEKWGLKDIRTVYSMKYYIQNRLKCLEEAN